MTPQLTDIQRYEIEQTALHFPFRSCVFGAVHNETGEFRLGAYHSESTMRKLARTGWTVYRVTKGDK